MFSVRIITVDHYMSVPLAGLDVFYSDFRGSEVKQVPVIRVFGSTPIGKKVCLHVHGVFPYIYVPYDGSEPNEREAYKLSSSLDKAINVSLGKSNAVTQHVYKISLVSGRPFYGYHAKEHQFFKIYLYNPIMVKRAADLLQSGAVLNKSFQPHEAHLTFILQFFIDFNLYGMNFINLSKVKYRHSIVTEEKTVDGIKNISIESFEEVPENLYLPESVPRMSTCELELDAIASAITNRSTVSEKMTVIPGLAAIWEEERERRRRNGLSSQLSPPPSQIRSNSVFTKTEFHYLERIENQFNGYKLDSHPLPVNVTNESVLDTSGYPSETPEDASVKNASLVEVQLPTPLKHSQNRTSDNVTAPLPPENGAKCLSSQNSMLLDTQDQMLLDAWEEMLEEKYEDSLLGTQPPHPDNEGIDDLVNELVQEEVEDNHLLEISQVFDWEEKMENKAIKNLCQPIVSNGNENTVRKSLNDNAAKSSNIVLRENIEIDNVIDEATEEKTKESLNAAETSEKNMVEPPNVGEVLNVNSRESPNDDKDLQKPDGEELHRGFSEKKEMKSKEDEEVFEMYEWEDDFWDAEDEEILDVEPIAQLDGVDDLTEPSEKVITKGVKDMLKRKRRLGVSGRVIGNSQKESLSEEKYVLSPGTSTGNTTDGNTSHSKNQISKEICKNYNISKGKAHIDIEDCVPQIPVLVAKHRRIHELKGMNRLSLSRIKEKIPSNYAVNSSEKSLSSSSSQIAHSYNMRRKRFSRINYSNRNEGKLLPNVSSLSYPIPSLKPCTVRLELIDESYFPYICEKNGVVLSNFTINQLKGISLEKKRISYSVEEKEMVTDQHSWKKISRPLHKEADLNSGKEIHQHTHNQSIPDKKNSKNDRKSIGMSTNPNADSNEAFKSCLSQASITRENSRYCSSRSENIMKDNSFIQSVVDSNNGKSDKKGVRSSKRPNFDINEAFNCSTSKESSMSENSEGSKSRSGMILIDNSFSDLEHPEQKMTLMSLKLSSNTSNTKKIDGKESSPKTPKKQKDKVASERNYYRPLNIVFQKSPDRSKNKEKQEELLVSSPSSSFSSHKDTDVVEKRDEKYDASDSQGDKDKTIHHSKMENNQECLIEEVKETKKLRYKPLQMVNINSSIPKEPTIVEKECIRQQDYQSRESIPSTTLGDEDVIVIKKVRKRLEFSDDSSSSVEKFSQKDHAKALNSSTILNSSTALNSPTVLDSPTALDSSLESYSESDHDYQASSTKSNSESSCDDEGLGILSFCEEDVFNSSLLTPNFAEKSLRRSQMPYQSLPSSKKVSFKERENEEEIFKLEDQDLKNTERISSTSFLSFQIPSLSANTNTEIRKQSSICKNNYEEALDDNGIEYAPLLKAPSRKEVEEYRDCQEPKGLPYCSDPDDIPSKPVEVGGLVLRLHSNRPNNLPQFESCLGITGIVGHRKRVLEDNFGGSDELEIGNQWEKISKTALLPEAGIREVIITPYEVPPKYEEVSQWLIDKGYEEAREKSKEDTPCNREEKKFKLMVGCPLNVGDDDEDPEVVSLSPCSSLNSQEVPSGKRISSLQSTPHSSLNSLKQQDKTASSTPHPSLKSSRDKDESESPNNSYLTFSPIRAETEEEDIIMCTPPPLPDSENSLNKKEIKSKANKICWSRKRLQGNKRGRKNLLGTVKEENLNAPPKNLKNGDESLVIKKPKVSKEDELKLQKVFEQKLNHHLVGLGGSGHSSCQIEGVSPNNTFGFQNSPSNLQNAKAIQQSEHVTVMTLEVQVRTRGDFRPDPEHDPIQAIFYCVVEDGGSQKKDDTNRETGILLVDSASNNNKDLLKRSGVDMKTIQIACDEPSLFKILGELMKKWDPDIMAGYEVEMQSWGYVLERGSHLRLDIKSLLSRIPSHSPSEENYKEKTNEPFEMDSKRIREYEEYDPFQIPGRIVLNVWRLMRSEVALMSYTFENVMYHLLHERVPLHSFKSLNNWWEHRTHLYRWITVEHWIIRVEGIMRLLFQLDLIGRTSELARLFGIQFYEVFSRGSQFRVESIMLRFAKPLNYVCVSPNSKQRSGMRAPEQLPLIMEPESRFFADPVIVLDFQSLYPSIIIAYNYCFSTCLGRVKHLGQPGPFEFGCTNLMVPPDQVAKLLSKQKKLSSENKSNSRAIINFSPCGVAFVGKEVREGILPRMLSEILETRLMVKRALKENKGNRIVERVLNSRQLGLKLIANVTYGYTSANFSGRMPCIEVGDSVVSKGRETLERAIALVHEKWSSQGVRVVYGDTDSLFVLAKGFSRAEAFKLGAKIAELVTENNPSPVKLKLEKVYQPCLLQTKKRYVGYAYETPDQEKPIFDAKGIETVRRDGCPAVAKVLGKSLRLLFDTRDISMVKLHVQRQLGKLLSGRLSLQELTFAREYRGAAGYRPGACVPALQLARRWVSIDRRAEPRSGERVPYVIVSGPPGLPLFQLVRSPSEFLMLNKQAGPSTGVTNQPQMRINAHYYITRVLVPPLQRCFSLIGADVESWYADMPRKFRLMLQPPPPSGLASDTRKIDNTKETSAGPKRSTIAEYFATSDCLSCGSQLDPGTQAALCVSCMENRQRSAFILSGRSNSWERTFSYLTKVCQSCCQRMEPIECTSLDCPILYRRHQALLEMEQATTLRIILSKLS